MRGGLSPSLRFCEECEVVEGRDPYYGRLGPMRHSSATAAPQHRAPPPKGRLLVRGSQSNFISS